MGERIRYWQCKKFGHRWGGWLEVIDGSDYNNFKIRVCHRCGITEQRTILDKVGE